MAVISSANPLFPNMANSFYSLFYIPSILQQLTIIFNPLNHPEGIGPVHLREGPEMILIPSR